MTIDAGRRTSALSRRGVLGATGLGVAGVLAQPLLPTAAAAAESKRKTAGYKAARYDSTPVPDEATRHILSRLTSGVTPQLVKSVDHIGGIDAWFAKQLTPNKIPDDFADSLYGWFPDLDKSAAKLFSQMKGGMVFGWSVMQELVKWTMLRRLYSKRQLLESMVDFWQNVVHVPEPSDTSWLFRTDYQKVLRQHALGSYENLLYAAITHPAMGLYLDNATSTKTRMNENLGREVLEMHTVGLNYTQHDVVNSAQILTGWRVDVYDTWTVYYSPDDHYVGSVKVLGFSDSNKNPDGRQLTKRYLSYLANHPDTAQKLCQRLAVRFVSDNPSADLVNQLAKVYLDSGTEIVPVLKALVASQEFKDSVGMKVRTPIEDAIATWAVLQVQVAEPKADKDAANQILNLSQSIGQQMFDWLRPDGFPDTADAWTGASRLLGSMRAHWLTAGSFWPRSGITWQAPTYWLPKLPIRFDLLVDHVSRLMLARPSSDALLQAACLATDCKPSDIITPLHRLVKTRLPWLYVTVLDTPDHLTR